MPKVGDIIYVGTSLYLSHGADDVQGGKAHVTEIKRKGNYIFVSVKEHPGNSYTWEIIGDTSGCPFLKDKQEKLKEQFGDEWAKEIPDLDPEFNKWD